MLPHMSYTIGHNSDRQKKNDLEENDAKKKKKVQVLNDKERSVYTNPNVFISTYKS